MKTEAKLSRFAKFAWFVLAYNILVILWGVFLRASKSGDGCGQHWLTCHGEVVPSAPELKTLIEFSHRIMSALDGLIVLALVVWAFRIWRRRDRENAGYILKFAAAAFVFVLIEGAIGAGLVLTGNTAETLTPARPFWMAAHLLNTSLLLAWLTVTAWSATTGRRARLSESRFIKWLAIGAVLLFLVGVSGSIAALSNMIFPSGTIADGIAKDFSPTSHLLLRLRPLHPIIAFASGVFFIFWAGWLKNKFELSAMAVRWANLLSILILAQLSFGALTLLMLGPILMQLGHLLLADALWIVFVLLALELLSVSPSAGQDDVRHTSPAAVSSSSER
ncbi:MAG: heme A synthase [Pyrinomonadaceae bacterium]